LSYLQLSLGGDAVTPLADKDEVTVAILRAGYSLEGFSGVMLRAEAGGIRFGLGAIGLAPTEVTFRLADALVHGKESKFFSARGWVFPKDCGILGWANTYLSGHQDRPFHPHRYPGWDMVMLMSLLGDVHAQDLEGRDWVTQRFGPAARPCEAYMVHVGQLELTG